MDVLPAGTSALYVLFGQDIDPAKSRRICRLGEALREACPEVLDAVPAYGSLYVEWDVLRTSREAVLACLERLGAPRPADAPVRSLRLPVLYGGRAGPDLEEVAALRGLDPGEVVALHAGRPYDVHFLGFAPGFPFMGEVDRRIATARLATPRPVVPAGSVGIAGRQTGIYPLATPGGWRLLGRTPVRLFRPEASPPFAILPGDRVIFVPIDEATYTRLEGGDETWS